MTEVLFRGEWVEESLVNVWLSKPENQRILEDEQAKEKAQAAEERKQLQKRKLAESKLKEKKIQECLQEVRAELPPGVHYDDDPKTHAYLLERAHNMYYSELRDEEYQKRRAEEQRQEEELAKREEQRRERERQQNAILMERVPEQQLQMFLSGRRDTCSRCYRRQRAEFFSHHPKCQVYSGIDIEPGLTLLREEFSTGKIIKRLVGQQAFKRLVEFAKPDETWEDCMNRLLDIADKADTVAKNGLTIY